MFDLFAFGTFWFWSLMTIAIVLMFVCTEFGAGGWATLCVIVTLLALNYGCGVPVFAFLWANPVMFLLGIVGYFVCGTGWAVAKWWFFVREQYYRYRELKKAFIKDNHLSITIDQPIPDELKEKWRDYCYRSHRLIEINPQVSDHKMSIYIWIAYFPFSAAWTLINDPVRKICRHIYHSISGILQQISDSVFANTKQDFKND